MEVVLDAWQHDLWTPFIVSSFQPARCISDHQHSSGGAVSRLADPEDFHHHKCNLTVPYALPATFVLYQCENEGHATGT